MAQIVEFVGLPGVGKSTLCQQLAAALASTGHTVHELARALHAPPTWQRLPRKAARCLGRIALAPTDTRALLRHVATSLQASPRATVSNLVNLLLVCDSSQRSARLDGIVLLDQGVLQALWSLGLEATTPPLHRELYDILAAPSAERLFVFLDADPAERATRLASRRALGARISPRHSERARELMESLWRLAENLERQRPGVRAVRLTHCDRRNPDFDADRRALEAVSRYLSERAPGSKAPDLG